MPHSQVSRPRCKSVNQLLKIADKFVQQDGPNQDMETLLQEGIDTLVNYQEECKKLRKWGAHPSALDPRVAESYEAAYVYYKIVSQLVLNKIPELPLFVQAKNSPKTEREKGLIEVYNMLVKTLLTDEKFAEIRRFIKDNSARSEAVGSTKQASNRQHALPSTPPTWTNGQEVSPQELASLLKAHKVLLLDLRPRIKFLESHIKCDTIMCIEPISFKDSYSDNEITKRSLITSPQEEVSFFRRRNTFDFIVIYTDQQDRNQFCQQKQNSLVDILLTKSFEIPLEKTTVLTLQGGFQSWCRYNGPCESSSSSINGGLAADYSIPPLLPRTTTLPKPIPSTNYSSDRVSVTHPMGGSLEFSPGPLLPFPEQRPPNIKRSSSFREKLSSMSPSLSRIGSPSSKVDLHRNESATYPETPHLSPSALQMESVSQAKIFEGVSLTPQSRSLSPAKVSNSLADGRFTDSNMADRVFPSASGNSRESSPRQMLGSGKLDHQSSNFTPSKKFQGFSIGLVNLGNSCYMNCVIQCLLGTYELCQIFLDDSYKNHVNLSSKLGSKGVLAKYFSQLIHTMQQKALIASKSSMKAITSGDERTAVQPIHFKVASGSINSLFKGSSQQDCQEFCQFLLDGLHEDLNQCGGNRSLKELSEDAEMIREKLCMRIASSIEWERYLTTDFSVIVDLFQGQYASQLRCKVCGRTSTTYQPFSVLSVPVPRGSHHDIVDCFKEFTKVETLEKDEQWHCPKCKIKQPSTKKITITRLPKNLIIHLKRFDNLLNKNNIFISYPHALDLTPFWANDFDGRLPPGVAELPTRGQVAPFNYNLYAVACHFGTLYGGHYTAYVNKGPSNGWSYFDDTTWRKAKSDTECITASAYVLFYHRVPNLSINI
ncbi:LADA_0A04962g1_1 [Lachancea dasiensis]|uniref:Ubiquitin carboxyl-terminal hydrolase n=1 Tax=Lachancea dasiensis TaxID=1072105 RepID=A0A1G4INS8_9SACH|nr:LADA_0A04962g1_1 [Lachancea dasiensis]